MPTKNYPTDTSEQAANVLSACKQIAPAMKIGSMTQEAFAYELLQAQSIQTQINELELQLIDLRNKREQRLTGIWEMIKRVRSVIKGTYGDDSSEYEMAGGTRMSERKKAPRKLAA